MAGEHDGLVNLNAIHGRAEGYEHAHYLVHRCGGQGNGSVAAFRGDVHSAFKLEVEVPTGIVITEMP